MFRRILLSLMLSSLLFLPVRAQSPCDEPPAVTGGLPRNPLSAAGPNGEDAMVRDMKNKQIKDLNQQRQASLKKDTEHLLQLATELKQQVDKTDEHVLSLDVLKKTDEIEKLAKSIREKMKANGYCDFPVATQP